jgi:hypothetical protein
MTTTMSAETVSTREAMHLGIAIHRLHATQVSVPGCSTSTARRADPVPAANICPHEDDRPALLPAHDRAIGARTRALPTRLGNRSY